MSQFYAWLGEKKSSRIRLAVMDMWKLFRLATKAHAPQAAILFDKFHVIRHLGWALDAVPGKAPCPAPGLASAATSGPDIPSPSRGRTSRSMQKVLQDVVGGQRHGLCSQGELRPAVDLRNVGWARRFFENWRASLKWQRLKPYEKFAEMIDRHWDGHRRLLPAGEQSLARLRGAQQQNPRDPTSRLWLAERGLPSAQNPDLHAAAL